MKIEDLFQENAEVLSSIDNVAGNSLVARLYEVLHSTQLDIDAFKSSTKRFSDCRRIGKVGRAQSVVEMRLKRRLFRF